MHTVSKYISLIAVVIALLSWLETRRMRRLTALALQRQSYEKVQTLPNVDALGVVQIGEKTRAKLIVFNHRSTPLRVDCVKCYIHAPKPRTMANWIRSKLSPFDWDYIRIESFWNPKGHLDDDEHYQDETLPFTFVKEMETLLVTIRDFSARTHYKFEVMTSQGNAIWKGPLPNSRTSLPFEIIRRID